MKAKVFNHYLCRAYDAGYIAAFPEAVREILLDSLDYPLSSKGRNQDLKNRELLMEKDEHIKGTTLLYAAFRAGQKNQEVYDNNIRQSGVTQHYSNEGIDMELRRLGLLPQKDDD